LLKVTGLSYSKQNIVFGKDCMRMPNFPIIDAHVHLWDPEQFRISWLDDNATLNKRFGLEEYRAQSAGVDIEAMVYVEVCVDAPYTFLEAKAVVEEAQKDARLQGIVAGAPLEDGERVRFYLEELRRLGSLMKGVRRNLQGEADPNFCLRPDFVQAIRMLPEYGLSFDICIRHQQLPAVIELVRQSPATSFMLDHIAKPAIKEQQLDPWREQISQLAFLPNVMCKVSGMVTEADHQAWMPADLAPYLEHVLSVFGEDRVAFGGDWPVSLLATDYRRWVETLEELTAHLSPEAQRKLWAENARRFYRLG
jgi:L-fuconolactonase